MIHGADYNPDQWKDTPEVWDEDMRLMKLAHTNSMSVGIFAWAALEPEEGRFEFGWLDEIMDKLYKNNAYVILATPREPDLPGCLPSILRFESTS